MSVGLCLRSNVNIFLSYYIVLNILTPYHFAFLQVSVPAMLYSSAAFNCVFVGSYICMFLRFITLHSYILVPEVGCVRESEVRW